jgi:tetrahydromethanopterin S-methyltransferase subunit F
MMAEKKINAPDPPVVDPPADPPVVKPSYEALEVRALQWEAEVIGLRAQLAARDERIAAELSRVMSEHNPDRDYQFRGQACFLVGYNTVSDQQKAWRWYRDGEIYGRKIGGRIQLCVNDLRDKVNKTGRHG